MAQSIIDWSAVCAVEAALVHEGYYRQHKDGYGPVLASVLDIGRAVSGVEFQRTLRRRMGLRGQFAELFTKVDVLLAPAQPSAPLKAGHNPHSWRATAFNPQIATIHSTFRYDRNPKHLAVRWLY